MFNSLLYLGTIVTAFAFFPGTDLREIKMAMAIVFAVSLSMAEIYSNGIRPNKNIWFILFMAYLPISIIMAPCPNVNLIGIDVTNFWSWKPFSAILVFSMMFLVISGKKFTSEEIVRLLKVMVWCGFITSLYEILQYFWDDQFFKLCADGDWGRVSGFIANPTLTAPFVAMLIPLALYLKDYLKAFIMVVGAVIPDCQTAWIALFIGIAVYFAMKGRKYLIGCSIIFLLSSAAFLFVYFKNQYFHETLFADHERFKNWAVIFKDWTGPLAPNSGAKNNFSLTGRGIGSFRFVYHVQHPGTDIAPNRFHQAHNDYLELGYSTGFVGLGLALMAIFHMIKDSFRWDIFLFGESRYKRALTSSFVIIATSAFCSFVWQIGTMAFYTVLICGLRHNERTPDL